ncbi:MAG: T9SS type A sorting domain-containing protein, partial [Bacteroidota bacterium]
DLNTIDFTFDVYLNGDSNLSTNVAPNTKDESQVRSSNMDLTILDKFIAKGAEIEIPFTFSADRGVEVFQLGFKNAGLHVEAINFDSEDHEALINNTLEGETKVLFVSDEPAKELSGTIKAQGLISGNISNIISLSSDFKREVVYTDFSMSDVNLEFRSEVEENLVDLQISPNPAQDYFVIQIPCDQNSESSITISDLQGRTIWQKNARSNELVIGRDELNGAGQYIVTWTHGNEVLTKKLVLL